MSTEQNKALVRRWVEEVINKDNYAVLNETHAANYINHFMPPGAPQGIEGEKLFTMGFRAGFADAVFTIDDMLAEGDRVAMRYNYRGTHTGTFNGIPATGKKFVAPGINTVRIVNGRIAENWVQFDVLGLMQQLGVIPSPG